MSSARVKHLNPRQGITTAFVPATSPSPGSPSCETPKSPPGDYNRQEVVGTFPNRSIYQGVKHLNPRQGITTQSDQRARADAVLCGV